MGISYEQQDLRIYLSWILKKINRRSLAAVEFYQWLEENEILLGLDLTSLKKKSGVKGKAYLKTELKVAVKDKLLIGTGLFIYAAW